ncbi:hypothetical protein N7492_000118 [Penicillium capsulatum]|uniref:Uncharacterized protein n=1 Tax=Penicillium capsulatum TaxID=69766 RepID=A0A9W9IR90_9EURO|nr:hypothetical protein N7492_000118 [Penicillium capsulatum]KAJ6130816.1 hypothetical protein N7512_003596 [Penicillium capsulatum]
MRWLLALGGLLSVCAPVLAGEWQLDSSCERTCPPSYKGCRELVPTDWPDLAYKNKVTSGMERAFTLTSQLQKTLDNIADNKKLEKNEKEIRQVIEWMLLKDAKELNEKTDFTALRSMFIGSYQSAWWSP